MDWNSWTRAEGGRRSRGQRDPAPFQHWLYILFQFESPTFASRNQIQLITFLNNFKKYYPPLPKTAPTMHPYTPLPRPLKPRVLFVLGGPGSGKGTQSQLIQQHFGFHHLSAGELLRIQRQNINSKHAKMIEQYMVKGTIVPCEITVKILEAEMQRLGFQRGKFLIDGFPRNYQNLRRWHMSMHPDVVVPFIVVLECGQQCMTERLLKRGKTSGRIDDNLEVIKRRFHTYHSETQPVIDYFAKQGRVILVNAEQSVELTFEEAKNKIQQRLNQQ